MIRFLFVLFISLLGLQSAFASDLLSSMYMGSRESDPSCFVENVSTIYGDYSEVEIDLTVPAPDSLILTRYYSSRDTLEIAKLGGWRFNSHCFLTIQKDPKGKNYTTAEGKFERKYIYVGNPSGSILTYVGWINVSDPSKKVLFKIDSEEEVVGLASTAKGSISSWTNQKNNELHFDPQTNSFELRLCTLGKRFYEKHPSLDDYFITHEVLQSGNKIFYEFDDQGQLTFIKETNALEQKVLAWIQIQYDDVIHIMTSDGKTVDYHFEQDPSGASLLSKVTRSEKPDLQYQYQVADNHALLLKKILPEGRFVQIDYTSNQGKQHRVRSVTTPISSNKTASVHFSYEENSTKVSGPDGNVSVYRYDEDFQLIAKEDYLNNSLYRIHKKSWGYGRDASNLISTSIEDADGNIFYYKSLTYDDKGNIIKESISGNLTGVNTGPIVIDEEGITTSETHDKTYSYFSGKNTHGFFQKDEKGTGIKFWYKKGTNLLLKKFILTKGSPDKEEENDNSGIKKRYFYQYNEDAALVRVIVDDVNSGKENYTYNAHKRLITSISPKQELPNAGVPEVIEEKYLDIKTKKEILLKRIINQFDLHGNIVSQSIYDANEALRYTTTKEYTDGLLISETDPIGNEMQYAYDANKNLITESHLNTGLIFDYGYDLCNRLIYTAERNSIGKTFETHITYGLAGNKISEIDRFGNETSYAYDTLGRLIQITYPGTRDGNDSIVRPTYAYSYDIFNNQTSVTDPKGRTTTTSYNSRRQPLAIHHFDGTTELFKYDIEGSLHRHLGRDGLVQVFEYDYIGRLNHIEYYKRGSKGSSDGFKRKYQNYNAFHLISEKDENDKRTTYSYDPPGRLVTLKKGEQKVEFIYDALGRTSGIKKWKSSNDFTLELKEYDLLNRVIQEQTEDSQGNVLDKMKYRYTDAGKLSQVIGYPQNQERILIQYEYDDFGRPIRITNGSNQVTQIFYDDAYINQWGQKTQKRTLIDPQGNQREEIYDPFDHVIKVIKKDKEGRLLQETESFYDHSGNKVLEKAARISSGDFQNTYESKWTFDQNDRLQSIALGKEGSQERVTFFEYNEYGDLSVKYNPSSKEPITYQYDASGNLQAISYKEGKKELRNQLFYDKKGNLKTVKLASSQVLTYFYDGNDLLLTEKIKDEFGSYQVSRTYDGEGKIQSLKLPDGSSIAYTYDGPYIQSAKRLSKEGKELYNYRVASRNLMGEILEEILPGNAGGRNQQWDPSGRRIELNTDFFQDKIPEGGYDPLENIKIRESSFDNEKYTTNYEYNALSQLIRENGQMEHQYAYDSLGNRLQKDHSNYKVDELNQLLETGNASYTFDANGNLASKTIGEKTWAYQEVVPKVVETRN